MLGYGYVAVEKAPRSGYRAAGSQTVVGAEALQEARRCLHSEAERRGWAAGWDAAAFWARASPVGRWGEASWGDSVRQRWMGEESAAPGRRAAPKGPQRGEAQPLALLARLGCNEDTPLLLEEWRHIFRSWTRNPPVGIASQNGPPMQIKEWVSIRDLPRDGGLPPTRRARQFPSVEYGYLDRRRRLPRAGPTPFR